MVRPSSTLIGNSIETDGLSPHSSARTQGTLNGQPGKSAERIDEESLNFLERAWLYLTDSDYYHRNRGPQNIDKVKKRVYDSYSRHGVFYGFTAEQKGLIARRIYESSRAAIPLAETVATIAVLPFGGASSLGSRIAVKIGANGVQKVFITSFVDSLGKEIASVGIDILADKKIDYPKRIHEIGVKLAIDSTAGALVEKLTPVLEDGFVLLSTKLEKFRVAGLKLADKKTATSAVDAKIIENAINELVNFTACVGSELIK